MCLLSLSRSVPYSWTVVLKLLAKWVCRIEEFPLITHPRRLYQLAIAYHSSYCRRYTSQAVIQDEESRWGCSSPCKLFVYCNGWLAGWAILICAVGGWRESPVLCICRDERRLLYCDSPLWPPCQWESFYLVLVENGGNSTALE